MRDKIISDNLLKSYCTDDERTAFSAVLGTSEDWLYEDGFDANKSAFAEKLSELKKIGIPMQKHQSESTHRPSAVSVLQKNIEGYTTWLNESQSDEKHTHITNEER